MKCRDDFVTNSSSSSFILSFKNEEKITPWGTSWESFQDNCSWSNYEQFFELINKLKESTEQTDKDKALEMLRNYYLWDYKDQVVNENIHKEEYENYSDYLKARNDYYKTEEAQTKFNTYLNENKEYQEKKKQIEEADLIVQGMIWDTSGGLLECAIRNDFIEQEFPRNHVITWHVG